MRRPRAHATVPPVHLASLRHRALTGHERCLDHLDSEELRAVLARLKPGDPLDVRGNPVSEQLLEWDPSCARHWARPAPFRMWLRPPIVVDDPRVDAERAGRSMVTKPCVAGSIPVGGTV